MINVINIIYKGEIKQTGFMHHYNTLYAIVRGLEAKTTFEFGTGISSKVIVEAQADLDSSLHTSCDTRQFDQTGLTYDFIDENIDRYKFIQGDSRLIPIPSTPYDFVLHDGSHEASILLQDLRKIVPLMKQNSILLVHDTISTEFNPQLISTVEKAMQPYKHELVTLPYGYGLTIVRILHDFGNGIVTPTWRK